jgi:hypothetical protein
VSKFELIPSKDPRRSKGLSRLLDTRLPLNRKEAFFTATVLPAIICADSFKHFDSFLSLLELRDILIDTTAENSNIEFFTEYSLAEAIYGDVTKDRFPNPPRTKERPDVMILIERSEPVLIAIEAKLYANIHASDLNNQMADQEEHVLSYLRSCWPGLRTVHVALLPKSMKQEFGNSVTRRMVTWEDILNKYNDVESARYFREILQIAIDDYERLRAKSSPPNGDDELTGAEILRRRQNGDLDFQTMGRQGGLRGDLLRDDIANYRWQEQHYYVRNSSVPHNANWFTVSDFFDLVSRKNLAAVFKQILESARNSETDDAAFGRRVRQLLTKHKGADLLAA